MMKSKIKLVFLISVCNFFWYFFKLTLVADAATGVVCHFAGGNYNLIHPSENGEVQGHDGHPNDLFGQECVIRILWW